MPSSLTITAQYTFVPYTKARAIHLNANFNNLRGHMLPIDPTDAEATDQEYNLGVSAYRWRAGYFRGLSLSMSIGSSHILYGTTAGGYAFVKDATTTYQFLNTYYKGHNATPMGPTSSAGTGQMAHSSPLNGTISSGFGAIAGSTCTLQTNGRPVLIGLKHVEDTVGASGIFLKQLTATANQPKLTLEIRGGVSPVSDVYSSYGIEFTKKFPAAVITAQYNYAPNPFCSVVIPPDGAQTYTFSITTDMTTAVQATTFEFRNVRLFAIELPG